MSFNRKTDFMGHTHRWPPLRDILRCYLLRDTFIMYNHPAVNCRWSRRDSNLRAEAMHELVLHVFHHLNYEASSKGVHAFHQLTYNYSSKLPRQLLQYDHFESNITHQSEFTCKTIFKTYFGPFTAEGFRLPNRWSVLSKSECKHSGSNFSPQNAWICRNGWQPNPAVWRCNCFVDLSVRCSMPVYLKLFFWFPQNSAKSERDVICSLICLSFPTIMIAHSSARNISYPAAD